MPSPLTYTCSKVSCRALDTRGRERKIGIIGTAPDWSYREYHIAVIGSGGVGKSCLTGMLDAIIHSVLVC